MSRRRGMVQALLLMGGVLLLVYYLAFYLPILQWRAVTLDERLVEVWHQVADANLESSAVEGVNLERVQESLERVRVTLEEMAALETNVADRVRLALSVEASMRQPFQLVLFQNQRDDQLDDLRAMAGAKKVQVAPEVYQAAPHYSADQRNPALLWAQLVYYHQLVANAMHYGATEIQKVEAQSARLAGNKTGSSSLHEIGIRIELLGPMEAVSKLLLSLPLTEGELVEQGMEPGVPEKPAMFIRRLLIRKSSPEEPDQVHLQLETVGFVYLSTLDKEKS